MKVVTMTILWKKGDIALLEGMMRRLKENLLPYRLGLSHQGESELATVLNKETKKSLQGKEMGSMPTIHSEKVFNMMKNVCACMNF